ncbi:DUF5615 family PIN-like protein [Thioalkalivibrio sp.]|uniref:DUF5615 family PIN-like protein n=1 Tax=Thioalkalivibrio sp. TaxID=2093813 RepID=UPI0025E0CFAF|nr:DUF5615 family PIN-like protein [Thioalkalivibrio sp.]
MRVLCDVHIPFRLVNRLREMGVDATHVNRVLDGSRTTDAAICAFVDQGGMLLITKDGDFRDSHYLRGSPARVLRVTLGNQPMDSGARNGWAAGARPCASLQAE